MTDRLAMWLVRLALLGVAAALCWWGMVEADLSPTMLWAAEHPITQHGKLAASETALGAFGWYVGVLAMGAGGLMALAALFPYGLFRKGAKR